MSYDETTPVPRTETINIKEKQSALDAARIQENARRARIKLAKLFDQGIRPVPVNEKALRKQGKSPIEREAEQLVIDVKRDNAGRRQHQKRTTNPKKLRRQLVRSVRVFTAAIKPD